MDQYSQLRVLGKGSFGAAWLVQRKKDGQQFVAKEVRLTTLKDHEKQSAKNEITTLRTLDHPNITKYVDHFEHRGSLFIIMEYANGGDLYTKIRSSRGVRIPEKEILHLFVQIALALMHLHEKHILHRDLKSQNVFLTRDGVVKLGDFGISTVLRNTYELKKTVCGTPYYFSPELCLNKPYNNKSDMWALGCILYEITTLTHAFDGNSMRALVQKILKGVYPPIHPSYSKDLAQLISTLLKIDPNMRPNVHQVMGMDIVRNSLGALKGAMEGANRDHRSCIDAEEKAKAKLEAQQRLVEEITAKKKREAEEKDRRERREKEQAQRVDQLKRQMERELLDEQERVRKIKEHQQEQKRVLEERNRQFREQGKKNRQRVEEKNKQREAEWEQNRQQLLQQQQEAYAQQQRDRAQEFGDNYQQGQRQYAGGGYDAEQAAAMYRQARREAEANRQRARMVEEQQMHERGGGVAAGGPVKRSPPQQRNTPPQQALQPPQRGGTPPDQRMQQQQTEEAVSSNRRRQMTEEEMDRARREAFWQMRREAEENKRRLMGLDPLPQHNNQNAVRQARDDAHGQQMATPNAHQQHQQQQQQEQPPPQQPQPQYIEEHPQPQYVEVQQHHHQPPPPPPQQQRKASPPQTPPQSPPDLGHKRRDADYSSDEDEDVGYHNFLNNDAIVEDDEDAIRRQEIEKRREAEYASVQNCIERALETSEAQGEDFEDPNEIEAGKFMLEGQTLHLPNVSDNDPLGHRIESLRVFLEQTLGDEPFIKIYRTLDHMTNEGEDDKCQAEVERYLSPHQQKYVALIVQLIVCEDQWNRQANKVPQ